MLEKSLIICVVNTLRDILSLFTFPTVISVKIMLETTRIFLALFQMYQ